MTNVQIAQELWDIVVPIVENVWKGDGSFFDKFHLAYEQIEAALLAAAKPVAEHEIVTAIGAAITSAVGKEQVTDAPRMVQVGGNQTQAEPAAKLNK